MICYFSQISVGLGYTCALTLKSKVYCWGGDQTASNGRDGKETRIPVAIDSGSKQDISFTKISVGHGLMSGEGFACGVTLVGKAYCWGNNENYGALGNNSLTNSSIPVAVAAPKGAPIQSFAEISSGSRFTCGISTSGQAFCWGDNQFGQLGNNNRADSNVPVAVVAPKGGSLLTFSKISSGRSHSCGLIANGTAYCWGANSAGELGNKSTVASSVPVPIVYP